MRFEIRATTVTAPGPSGSTLVYLYAVFMKPYVTPTATGVKLVSYKTQVKWWGKAGVPMVNLGCCSQPVSLISQHNGHAAKVETFTEYQEYRKAISNALANCCVDFSTGTGKEKTGLASLVSEDPDVSTYKKIAILAAKSHMPVPSTVADYLGGSGSTKMPTVVSWLEKPHSYVYKQKWDATPGPESQPESLEADHFDPAEISVVLSDAGLLVDKTKGQKGVESERE